VLDDLHAGAPLGDLAQARARLSAFSVEQYQFVAGLLAHDVQVMGDRFRQVDDAAREERLGTIKAWHG
jgi:hypothetical protein